MTRKRWCVECRFCQLRVDFDAGSHYFCGIQMKPLESSLLSRRACRRFQQPLPAAYWGP